MKLHVIAVIAVLAVFGESSNAKVFLGREDALQYLKREKRANSHFFEEVHEGNAERECIEEVCDREEVREVFENNVQTAAYWRLLTEQCSTWHNHCDDTGTLRCENQYNSHRCVCKNGYTGSNCETEVNECEFGYCPVGSQCEDLINSFRCICPSSGCLSFLDEYEDV